MSWLILSHELHSCITFSCFLHPVIVLYKFFSILFETDISCNFPILNMNVFSRIPFRLRLFDTYKLTINVKASPLQLILFSSFPVLPLPVIGDSQSKITSAILKPYLPRNVMTWKSCANVKRFLILNEKRWGNAQDLALMMIQLPQCWFFIDGLLHSFFGYLKNEAYKVVSLVHRILLKRFDFNKRRIIKE